jgi:hypothetical protein
MEVAQSFIFDAGWIFFAAWVVVLAALGAVAFGHDIVVMLARSNPQGATSRSAAAIRMH